MEAALLVVNSLAMVVIAWQAYEIRKQAKGSWAQVEAVELQTAADHERRKKQATIEYYSQLRASRIELQSQVEVEFGREVVSDKEMAALMNRVAEGEAEAEDLVRLLRNYLAGLERLATGVNLEVFDYETVRRLGGSHVVGAFQRHEAYIRATRHSTQQKTLYCELERLALRLRSDRAMDDTGKIENS